MPLGTQITSAEVLSTTSDGVRTLFIEHPAYFDRDYLYGTGGHDYADNAERFAFLARAALEWAAIGPPYDVIHGHDWQAGLVPVLLRTAFADHPWLGTVPAVFTIHNLAYQGIFDASWLPRLGLGWELMNVDALEYLGPHQLSEGRHHVQSLDHHRQPDVCPGNPDSRIRVRLRWHPPVSLRRPRRDSERNRLRSVGSRPRCQPARAVRRLQSGGKGPGEARGAGARTGCR